MIPSYQKLQTICIYS